MILNIDIRVSNDNGVQVHQFTKHFDSRFEGKKIEGDTNSLSKSFEEFLSEFLSGSGRLIRNQLIADRTDSTNIESFTSPAYNNIEYTLKLGESQSVSGKIPLDKLFRLNEIAKLSSDFDSKTPPPNEINRASVSDIEKAVSADFSHDTASFIDESLVLKRTIFQEPIDLMEVDQMFQQIITTAVTRYEDSFFVNVPKESRFIESS